MLTHHDFPRLLSYPQVAEITGMSQSWLRKGVSCGRLPHVKIGRSVRFRPEDIEAMMTPKGGAA